MRSMISVEALGGSTYKVIVEEGGGRTEHEVTAAPDVVERYAPGSTPERLLEASFEFLLEREPKEAILGSFDVSVISRYFPEFERELQHYLPQS